MGWELRECRYSECADLFVPDPSGHRDINRSSINTIVPYSVPVPRDKTGH